MRWLWLAPTSVLAIIAACGGSDSEPSAGPNDAGANDARARDDDATTDDGGSADADARPEPGDAGCVEIFHEHFLSIDPVWTTSVTSGTVTTSPDGGQYYTGALRAEVTSSGTAGAARVEREIEGGVPEAVGLTFAMRIEAVSATGNVTLGCSLQLRTASGIASVDVGSGVANQKVRVDDAELGPVAIDKWYQVKLHLSEIRSTGARFIGDIDGTRLIDRDVSFPAPPEQVRVKCGIDHADPAGSATVFVDDVILATCTD